MVFISHNLIQEPAKVGVVAFNLFNIEGDTLVEPMHCKDFQCKTNLDGTKISQ
jgi:hypothetical protein